VASKSHSDVSAFIAFPTFGIEALCCCAAWRWSAWTLGM
jgi:hypothetical protein